MRIIVGNSVQTSSDNSFGFWDNPKLALVVAAAWVGLLVVFRAYPNIDLAIAGLFHDPAFCATWENKTGCISFPVAYHPVFAPLREILNYSPRIVGIGLIVLVIAQLIKGLRWQDIALRKSVLALAALISGPLLIVNGVLKEHFGRVRPRNISEFGGSLDFTLPGDIVGQCISNCSFVSGEGAAGGWFLCLGVLAATHHRMLAYTILFIIGFGMAMLRVAFGAHFFSDASLGYLLSIIVFFTLVILSERLLKPDQKTNPHRK